MAYFDIRELCFAVESLIIDAASQTGNSGAPLIELNGANSGPTANGFRLGVGGNGSTIQGVAINRFSGEAIYIAGVTLPLLSFFERKTGIDGGLRPQFGIIRNRQVQIACQSWNWGETGSLCQFMLLV